MKNVNKDANENRWVVQVYQEQHVAKKAFSDASEASAWASRFAVEANVRAGSDFDDLRVSDIFDRYAEEESPKRVCYKKQLARFKYFKTQVDKRTGEKKYPIVDILLKDLNRFDFVRFRDQQRKEVANGTFIQDWSLVHRAIKIAVNEWGWLHRDPMQVISVPPTPRSRARRISDSEVELLSKEILAYEYKSKTPDAQLRALFMFHLALETALRRSEIFSLRRREVFLDKGYLRVTGIEANARKSDAAVRDVPLTARARDVLAKALERNWDSEFVFGIITGGGFDRIFRGAVQSSGIQDLHFHDTRHEAISRLARHYRSIDLAIIVGHQNIQHLMSYYRPTISELVEILEGSSSRPKGGYEKDLCYGAY